jgi:NAD(P)-dependent dehydrogenase (short-subunit alcohol dehydrogenase family)
LYAYLIVHGPLAIPLGRAAQPDDVARVALFCASDLAAYMTGSMLFADGGDMVG